MPQLLLGLVLVGGLLAVELGALPPTPAAAATILPAAIPLSAAIPAAPGPCVAGWREMPIPDASFISTPFEAATRAGRPAWILGGSNSGVLALKWTGSWWKRAAKGSRGHRGIVAGVPTSSRKALTVGYYRPAKGNAQGSLDPVSGRLVGTTYKGRRVPDPPGPRASLTAVVNTGGGKAWAMGTRLQGGKLKAYAIRWNGKSWSRKDPASGSGAGLLAADRTPSGAIWVAGWKEASRGRPRPLIAKRTNKGWKTTRGATLPAGSAVITDLDFRGGGNGWAIGYLVRVGSSRHEVFLEHWNGQKWSLVPLPWAGDFSAIPRSISVGAGGEIWIGGSQLATGNREARGFIAHLEDDDWEISVLGVPKGLRSEVMDVSATKWGAVAAANVGSSLLVLRTCVESASVASSGSRKVSISNIKARRESQFADPDHGGSGNVSAAGPDTAIEPAVAPAGVQQTLGSPTKPKGFVVRDKAAASGLASTTRTFDGFATDFDGNGWKDVFYSRHGSVLPRLAMGSARGFSNAKTGAFSTVDRHGCDHGDLDHDGAKDVFCAVGAARGKAIGRHELSLAVATKNRRLARGSLGISDPLGRGRQVGIIRLDKDPYPEVFIVNEPDRDDGMPGYNRFFRNEGGRFVSAPGVGLDTTHGGWCVLTGDFDKDGDEDLLYCTAYGVNGRQAGLRYMRNEGGKLRDRTGGRGIKPMGDIAATFGDVNGDGHKDLIQLSRTRLRVSKWTRGGVYRKIYEVKLTDAWAVAAGDASGDGKADIYIARGTDKKNRPDRLLVSRKGGTKFRSVKIPQTSKGTADDVFAIDYDRNGLTDFVVLNGRIKAGPIQLLASFRTR